MIKIVNVSQPGGDSKVNRLLEIGYEILSVDNMIYTLSHSQKKVEDEFSVTVNLDTSKADRAMKLLGETVTKLQDKQPHVRIEFDDIHDEPKVWVDGIRDYEFAKQYTVIVLNG
ncbi:hypothetical protein DIS12_04610 [Leuconostoc citreum]|uniref:hypothetical protein n=1 Tax=Leuconostoc citreum TaxID=33964 RepID=UPI00111FD5DE|nr:hypothetical protein [Leuconostoc citreum]TOY70742.1 hypothetical protein DIS12_04610 [Leuconostoc citreum]